MREHAYRELKNTIDAHPTIFADIDFQIRTKFAEWLPYNTTIFNEFARIAKSLKDAGHPKWSARAILHHMRLERGLRDTDATYQINSIHSPCLSRC
jgi:hypothetical protein